MSARTHSLDASPLCRLTGHNGAVHAVTFSAGSGQYLLTGSSDRTIRLFNSTTGNLIQKYSVHGYEVLDIAVAEDNARFVSVGGDKTVFLWDVATAQTTRRFTGHAGRINGVDFGGEGDSIIASGSFDGRVLVWDTKAKGDSRPIMSLNEGKDAITSVKIHDTMILAASVDGRARVYDLRAGKIRVDVLGQSVTSMVPDKMGDAYLASTLDSKLRLMDVSSGKCLQTFTHDSHRNETYRLRSTFMAADTYVASGTEDGRVLIWDVLTGNLVKELQHTATEQRSDLASKKSVVSAVAWNRLRKQFASAGGDGDVVVWDFKR